MDTRTNTAAATDISATDIPAIAIKAQLARFTGTERWYRHPLFRDLLTTEGVQYLADHAGAHWLVDAIAAAQVSEAALQDEPFQVWRLKVNADRSAVLTYSDGNNGQLFRSEVSWTDFPLDQIDIWYADNTLYLPSEH
jgi:thiazole synthase ThiGH ThiG subunit